MKWASIMGAATVALAAACGSSSSAPPAECDLDPGLSAAECTAVKGLALDASLPPSHGNTKADDANAQYFGFMVFFDARFSSNENVRCATCHLPEKKFDDGLQTSQGLSVGPRNSPTALNAARMTTFFWDGRADSLWSQPLFAFENPLEMNFTRLEIAHRLVQSFSQDYSDAFGPLPDISDATRFPAKGKPGDAAWEAMAAADQETINRVVSNLGKAIEAYLRKLATGTAPFDKFIAGDATQLTEGQRRGMRVLVKSHCLDCHSGPMMSDMGYHNIGVPALDGAQPDPGRAAAYAILSANPFNGQGSFFDGTPLAPETGPNPGDLGAFRTPTLRNITLTAPYMHNGSSQTLQDAIAFHAAGGGRGGSGFVGDVDPLLTPQSLSQQDIADLVDFFGTLQGSYPGIPWNNWPQK
jgi:cytochrome c peroxidase